MIRNMQTRIVGPLVIAAVLAAGATFAADALDPAEAANHVGEEATVCGEVTGAKYSDHRKRKPTFIDFGPPHPNQIFTALICWARRSACSARSPNSRAKWRSRLATPRRS